MTSKSRKRFLAISLYLGFSLSLAGSVCGTLAWYTYGMKVPVKYNGVSIGDTGALEVGFVSDVRLTNSEIEQFSFVPDYTYPGKNIYWVQGSFQSSMLAFFEKKNGYADDYLRPVTVGKYSGEGDQFVLKNGPGYCKTFKNEQYEGHVVKSNKNNYIKLFLAFKYRGDDTSEEYNDNFNVYLSAANASSDSGVHKGVRMYVEGYERNILINPNSKVNTTLISGGRLDLNNDGYFDYIERVTLKNYVEYAYGEFEEGALYYNDVPYPIDSTETPTDEQINSTFDGVSKPGVYQIDEARTIWPKIEFDGMSTALNKEDFILARPNNTRNIPYAFCNITIYLEGWDRNVDNEKVLTDFSFDLLFEAI